jgi:hypothetical protein
VQKVHRLQPFGFDVGDVCYWNKDDVFLLQCDKRDNVAVLK